jgi:hypothetical protein
MSKRNGDRARFQKERKRKMLRRQRRKEAFNSGASLPQRAGLTHASNLSRPAAR